MDHSSEVEIQVVGVSSNSCSSGFSEALSSEFSGEPLDTTVTAPPRPILAFSNISFSIPFGWRGGKKTILHQMSGTMTTGLNAIMGPTGSGKTTLLDILASRKASSRVSGMLLYDSEEPDIRPSMAYVVQDDIVSGSLTVRENLFFSAALRLPSKMTQEERKERVQSVIDDLRLDKCADRKIGTDFIRGVSGGERRRTNIGMELITKPQILFLDEPTSGLDSHTADVVLQILKELTRTQGRIVVMSIHQPRYSIFKLFDTLTLLSSGKLVYHGPSQTSIDYFKSIGFECEEHNNPADFFLDSIMSIEHHHWADNTSSSSNQPEAVVELCGVYEKSSICRRVEEVVEPLRQSDRRLTKLASQYVTGALWQFLVVSWRSVLGLVRSPMTIIMQMTIMLVMALAIGGIFFRRPDTPRGMQDRFGVLFFLVVSQVFSSLGAVELFIREKAMFLHETSAGYYRVSVYFLAKLLADLLVLRLLPLTLFCVITYFMIGLQADVSKFFIFYLTLTLTTLSSTAVAFAFSALVSVFALANLLVSMVFIVYVMFGGFLIGLSSLPPWIQWMQYVSIFRYAIEALTANELSSQVYIQELIPTSEGLIDPNECLYMIDHNNSTGQFFCVVSGDSILHFQGYKFEFPWIWYDETALFIHGMLWLILAYCILRIVKVYYKQFK